MYTCVTCVHMCSYVSCTNTNTHTVHTVHTYSTHTHTHTHTRNAGTHRCRTHAPLNVRTVGNQGFHDAGTVGARDTDLEAVLAGVPAAGDAAPLDAVDGGVHAFHETHFGEIDALVVEEAAEGVLGRVALERQEGGVVAKVPEVWRRWWRWNCGEWVGERERESVCVCMCV